MFAPLSLGRSREAPTSLRQAAVSGSLVGRLNRLAVDTETKRSSDGTSKDAMTDEDPSPQSSDPSKRPRSMEDRAKDQEKKLDQGLNAVEEFTMDEVKQELKVVKASNPDEIPDDMIVQAMANQNRMCLLNGTTARIKDLNELYRSSNRAVEIDGEMVVPLAPIDKMDLVIPFDAWKGMKLLEPRSSAAERALHATIEMNFLVDEPFVERLFDPTPFDPCNYEEGKQKYGQTPPYTEDEYQEALDKAEKEAKRRAKEDGMSRSYVLGEIPYSTGSAPTQESLNKTDEEYRDFLRRETIVKFGYNSDEASGGSVSISMTDLDKQSRRAGIPTFTQGRFLRMCNYPAGMKRDDSGRPTKEWEEAYARTNKYKTEVARLWWKMFINQEDEVQRVALYLAGIGSLQEAEGAGTTSEERRSTIPDRTKEKEDASFFNVGAEKIASDEFYKSLIKAKEDANKLLRGENQKEEVLDEKRIRAEQQKELDNVLFGNEPMVLAITELGASGRLDVGSIIPEYVQEEETLMEDGSIRPSSYPKKFCYVLENPDDVARNRATDAGVQQIQQIGNYTWPLVKIGRTAAWLNWLSGVNEEGVGGFGNSIKARNKLAYQVLQLWFEDDVGNVNPWTDEYFPTELLGSTPDTPENRALVWSLVEDVFTDICQACPAWAQAYLSMELVDDPDLKKADDAAVAELKEGLAAADTDETLRINRQIELLSASEESAREMASLVWNGYHTENEQIRSRLDDHGNRNTTWAHEQLLRCVTGVRAEGVEPELDYRLGAFIDQNEPKKKKMNEAGEYEKNQDGTFVMVDNLIPGLRAADRDEVRIGEPYTADYYQSWHTEIYTKKGEGNVGQLCTLQMMYNYKKEKPWYVHAQGRTGTIVEIADNPDKGKEHVSPNLYLVHVNYVVSHESNKQYKEDVANGVCTPDRKLIVKVPGDYIWPFSFKSPFRYGDQAVLERKDAGDKYKKLLEAYPNEIALTDYKWFAPTSVLKSFGLDTQSSSHSEWVNARLRLRGGIYFVKWNHEIGGGNKEKGGKFSARNPDYMYFGELDNTNPGRICRTEKEARDLVKKPAMKSFYAERTSNPTVGNPANISLRVLDESGYSKDELKETKEQAAARKKALKNL